MKLNCRKCNAQQKIMRGCEKEAPDPSVWEVNGETFGRCPRKMVKLESYEYIRAYNRYCKGFLPNPGGYLKQPAKLMEAIDIIENQLAKEE